MLSTIASQYPVNSFPRATLIAPSQRMGTLENATINTVDIVSRQETAPDKLLQKETHRSLLALVAGSSHKKESSKTKAPPMQPQAAKRPDPGEKEKEAQEKEKQQQDKLRADEILKRMEAEKRLHQAKMQAILLDTQTEIQRIFREAYLHRQKINDDLLKAWTKVFIG